MRNLRRRQDLRASTLEALCCELGLEFYVGPLRDVPVEIARALELPDDCSLQDALAKINLQREAGSSTTIRSLVELVEQIASDLRKHLQETGSSSARAKLLRAATGTGFRSRSPATMIEEGKTALATPASGSSGELIHLKAFDDSMDPAITDGELVMLDCSQAEPIEGEVFLIHSGSQDEIAIRRLRKVGNEWQSCSDNAMHPSRPLGEDEIILGRVWLVGKRAVTVGRDTDYPRGWGRMEPAAPLMDSVPEEDDGLEERTTGVG